MKFSELNIHSPLKNALDEMGLSTCTTIQKKAFPVIMSGKDTIGIAQTGTGKTIAYLLPLLRMLTFSNQRHPRVLVLVPTRELVVQVTEEAQKLGTYQNNRIGGVYGGTNINTQKEIVLNGLDVLIATPGRLVDLVLNGALKLTSIQKLVIDEVDEMMDLGFRPQLQQIFDLLPEKRQNLMFSATLTADIEKLIEDFFFMPEKVEAAPQGTPAEKIKQIFYEGINFNTKINLLCHLLDSHPEMNKVLVFCESKKIADFLEEKITPIYPEKIGIIHSNKSQNYRLNALQNFEKGIFRILVATDLVSRGLDIEGVSHVINMDAPEIANTYIHRIGRTGRADKEGVAITFVGEKENDRIDGIKELTQQNIDLFPLPEEVEIVDKLEIFEKPQQHGSTFHPKVTPKSDGGAFHEKKEKNKKVNLGGSYRRKLKEKYKKPIKKRK